MEDLLHEVEKKFLSGYPLNKFLWQSIIAFIKGNRVDEAFFQNSLLKRTIHHQLMEKFPLKLSYRQMFLKMLINKMEDSKIEICDEMYEAYCHILAQIGNSELNGQDKHFRHFVLGKIYISLNESTHIVSEGTTGLYAWQASIALAEWCLQHQDTVLKNKKILELGSGVGLTGLACLLGTAGNSVNDQSSSNMVIKGVESHIPVSEVGKEVQLSGNPLCSPMIFTFSDCHPSVLQLLCKNVRLNVMEDDSSESDLEKSADGSTLLETYYEATKVRVVNLLWQDLEAGTKDALEMVGQVDIVIAADVVYDQSLFKPLIGSLKKLASKNIEGISPMVILACTKRNSVTLDCFMDCLTSSGLLAHEDEPVQPLYFTYDPDPPVGIYLISMQQCD